MEKKADKIGYITFLQSLAVFLVIVGHCLQKADVNPLYPVWAEIILKFVYSFHMPLFFVIAGFLFTNSFIKNSNSIKNFKVFINNKFKRLIVPYFTIGTLSYLLKVFIFNKYAYKPAHFGLINYMKSMLKPFDNANGYMWFLPTIFVVFILGYLIFNRNNYKKVDLLLWFSSCFLISFFSKYTNLDWFNISGILYYLFYFLMGVLFFNFKDTIYKFLSVRGTIVIIILLFLELHVLPHFKYNFCNYALSYITAITGILVSIILAYYCSKRNIKFFAGIIDGFYYQIYLLSWFFQRGVRVLYQINLINYTSACVIAIIAGIAFPILITYIIKRFMPRLKIFIGL